MRTGLDDLISKSELQHCIELPATWQLGDAINDGGCFFDALAQILNRIYQADKYNEAALRKLCHQQFMQQREKVDALNQTDATGVQGDDYAFVQYTAPELKTYFNDRPSIWGRTEIEGRLLCDALGLPTFQVIELHTSLDNGSLMPMWQRVDKNRSYSCGLDYNPTIPTLVVGGNHYIPLLPPPRLDTSANVEGVINASSTSQIATDPIIPSMQTPPIKRANSSSAPKLSGLMQQYEQANTPPVCATAAIGLAAYYQALTGERVQHYYPYGRHLLIAVFYYRLALSHQADLNLDDNIMAVIHALCLHLGLEDDAANLLTYSINARRKRDDERLKNLRRRCQTVIDLNENEHIKVNRLHTEVKDVIASLMKSTFRVYKDGYGAAPCSFCVIGFGSMADGLMTPYSDIEFALLIERDTLEARAYFRAAVQLLHLRIILLGETTPHIMLKADAYEPVPSNLLLLEIKKGLSFNRVGSGNNKTPLGSPEGVCLFGNVDALVNSTLTEIFYPYHTQSIDLQHHLYLCGEEELWEHYHQRISRLTSEKIPDLIQNKTISEPSFTKYTLFWELINKHLRAFDPKLDQLGWHFIYVLGYYQYFQAEVIKQSEPPAYQQMIKQNISGVLKRLIVHLFPKSVSSEKLDKYYKCCSDYKIAFDEERKTMQNQPPNGLNEHFLNKVNQTLQELFKNIWKLSICTVEGLGCQVPKHTVFVLGSLADGIATLYSDIEFGIIIECRADKRFFEKVTQLAQAYMILLGETKLSILQPPGYIEDKNNPLFNSDLVINGVSFDGAGPGGGKSPLGRVSIDGRSIISSGGLLATVPEFVEQLTTAITEKDKIKDCIPIANAQYCMGDSDLWSIFNAGLTDCFSRNQAKIRVAIGKNLKAELFSFQPIAGRALVNGREFSAKYDLLRFPIILLQQLNCMVWKPKKEKYIITDVLKNIDPQGNKKLEESIISAANMRIMTYGASKGQNESTPLDTENKAKIKELYDEIIPLYLTVRQQLTLPNLDRISLEHYTFFRAQKHWLEAYWNMCLQNFKQSNAYYVLAINDHIEMQESISLDLANYAANEMHEAYQESIRLGKYGMDEGSDNIIESLSKCIIVEQKNTRPMSNLSLAEMLCTRADAYLSRSKIEDAERDYEEANVIYESRAGTASMQYNAVDYKLIKLKGKILEFKAYQNKNGLDQFLNDYDSIVEDKTTFCNVNDRESLAGFFKKLFNSDQSVIRHYYIIAGFHQEAKRLAQYQFQGDYQRLSTRKIYVIFLDENNRSEEVSLINGYKEIALRLNIIFPMGAFNIDKVLPEIYRIINEEKPILIFSGFSSYESIYKMHKSIHPTMMGGDGELFIKNSKITCLFLTQNNDFLNKKAPPKDSVTTEYISHYHWLIKEAPDVLKNELHETLEAGNKLHHKEIWEGLQYLLMFSKLFTQSVITKEQIMTIANMYLESSSEKFFQVLCRHSLIQPVTMSAESKLKYSVSKNIINMLVDVNDRDNRYYDQASKLIAGFSPENIISTSAKKLTHTQIRELMELPSNMHNGILDDYRLWLANLLYIRGYYQEIMTLLLVKNPKHLFLLENKTESRTFINQKKTTGQLSINTLLKIATEKIAIYHPKFSYSLERSTCLSEKNQCIYYQYLYRHRVIGQKIKELNSAKSIKKEFLNKLKQLEKITEKSEYQQDDFLQKQAGIYIVRSYIHVKEYDSAKKNLHNMCKADEVSCQEVSEWQLMLDENQADWALVLDECFGAYQSDHDIYKQLTNRLNKFLLIIKYKTFYMLEVTCTEIETIVRQFNGCPGGSDNSGQFEFDPEDELKFPIDQLGIEYFFNYIECHQSNMENSQISLVFFTNFSDKLGRSQPQRIISSTFVQVTRGLISMVKRIGGRFAEAIMQAINRLIRLVSDTCFSIINLVSNRENPQSVINLYETILEDNGTEKLEDYVANNLEAILSKKTEHPVHTGVVIEDHIYLYYLKIMFAKAKGQEHFLSLSEKIKCFIKGCEQSDSPESQKILFVCKLYLHILSIKLKVVENIDFKSLYLSIFIIFINDPLGKISALAQLAQSINCKQTSDSPIMTIFLEIFNILYIENPEKIMAKCKQAPFPAAYYNQVKNVHCYYKQRDIRLLKTVFELEFEAAVKLLTDCKKQFIQTRGVSVEAKLTCQRNIQIIFNDDGLKSILLKHISCGRYIEKKMLLICFVLELLKHCREQFLRNKDSVMIELDMDSYADRILGFCEDAIRTLGLVDEVFSGTDNNIIRLFKREVSATMLLLSPRDSSNNNLLRPAYNAICEFNAMDITQLAIDDWAKLNLFKHQIIASVRGAQDGFSNARAKLFPDFHKGLSVLQDLISKTYSNGDPRVIVNIYHAEFYTTYHQYSSIETSGQKKECFIFEIEWFVRKFVEGCLGHIAKAPQQGNVALECSVIYIIAGLISESGSIKDKSRFIEVVLYYIQTLSNNLSQNETFIKPVLDSLFLLSDSIDELSWLSKYIQYESHKLELSIKKTNDIGQLTLLNTFIGRFDLRVDNPLLTYGEFQPEVSGEDEKFSELKLYGLKFLRITFYGSKVIFADFKRVFEILNIFSTNCRATVLQAKLYMRFGWRVISTSMTGEQMADSEAIYFIALYRDYLLNRMLLENANELVNDMKGYYSIITEYTDTILNRNTRSTNIELQASLLELIISFFQYFSRYKETVFCENNNIANLLTKFESLKSVFKPSDHYKRLYITFYTLCQNQKLQQQSIATEVPPLLMLWKQDANTDLFKSCPLASVQLLELHIQSFLLISRPDFLNSVLGVLMDLATIIFCDESYKSINSENFCHSYVFYHEPIVLCEFHEANLSEPQLKSFYEARFFSLVSKVLYYRMQCKQAVNVTPSLDESNKISDMIAFACEKFNSITRDESSLLFTEKHLKAIEVPHTRHQPCQEEISKLAYFQPYLEFRIIYKLLYQSYSRYVQLEKIHFVLMCEKNFTLIDILVNNINYEKMFPSASNRQKDYNLLIPPESIKNIFEKIKTNFTRDNKVRLQKLTAYSVYRAVLFYTDWFYVKGKQSPEEWLSKLVIQNLELKKNYGRYSNIYLKYYHLILELSVPLLKRPRTQRQGVNQASSPNEQHLTADINELVKHQNERSCSVVNWRLILLFRIYGLE